MSVFPDIFTEMAVLLLLAAGVGALGVRVRQPLIVAFIAAESKPILGQAESLVYGGQGGRDSGQGPDGG